MLRIFMHVKIQRLRPSLNRQTWVPEASMLTTRPQKPSKIVYLLSGPVLEPGISHVRNGKAAAMFDHFLVKALTAKHLLSRREIPT